MPELPDIRLYQEAIRRRVLGRSLSRARITSPFVVRTFDPPIDAIEGREVLGVERLGKRIVLCLSGDHSNALADDLYLVIHPMIAGRFRWIDAGDKASFGKIELARFTFDNGTLVLTEAGTKKRASIHVMSGRANMLSLGRGGIDVFTSTPEQFGQALQRENRTIKKALTDPSIIDGIGNAYSDEILHAARMSPLKLTRSFKPDDIARLHAAAVTTLQLWIDRLFHEFGLDDPANPSSPGKFPGAGDITAFRPDFAVHGRFEKPCPVCTTKVQRVISGDNEWNYCPRCQTNGKVLADRSLSRLLKDDWPGTVEDLEDE